MSIDLAPGTVIGDRWSVAAALGQPTAWGAVYNVRDERGQIRVARLLRVPPLRSGLEARLASLEEALAEWRSHPHPSRVGIVAWTRLDDAFCVVTTRAAGTVAEAVAQRRAGATAAWRVRVASCLAEALLALLDLPLGSQSIMHLSAAHVLVADDGVVTFVNPGVGRFLKPVMTDADTAALRTMALQRFGEILHVVLTGDAFDATDVLVASRLPEGIGEVALRALVPARADAFADLQAVARELKSFEALAWAEALENPVARERMTASPTSQPFALRAFSEKARYLWPRRPLLRAAVALWVVIALFMVAQGPSSVPAIAQVSGPAVFVVEEDGAVEVVEVGGHEVRGRFDIGAEVTDGVYSTRLGKAVFTAPSRRELVSLDLATRGLTRSSFPGQGSRSLILLPGQTMALGIPSRGLACESYGLSRLDARGSTVTLPEPVRAVVYVPVRNALACLSEAGDRLFLWSVNGDLLATRTLEAPAKAIRLDSSGRQLWVLSTRGGGEALVVEPSTLQTQLAIPLREPPLDIAFGEAVYLLLASSGDVAVVSRESGQVERFVPGQAGTAALLLPKPDELWLLGASGDLEVLSPAGGTRSRRIQLHGKATRFFASSPP